MGTPPWRTMTRSSAHALLGIDADADEREIKRAYARLLKTTRPDEDPAGFQRLNDAYQFCLRQLEEGGPGTSQGSGIDAHVAHVAHAYEREPAVPPPFDIGQFIAALLDVSRTASGRDILGWLQAHPAFYSIGARETLAPEIVNALLRAPALPPRHAAAVLHFLQLDTAGPARAWLEPSVSALERYAQMTLEDIQAIRKPYVESPPSSSSSSLGWSFGATLWIVLIAMISLARCSGGGP